MESLMEMAVTVTVMVVRGDGDDGASFFSYCLDVLVLLEMKP
jgi:hypothetical protein